MEMEIQKLAMKIFEENYFGEHWHRAGREDERKGRKKRAKFIPVKKLHFGARKTSNLHLI